MIDQFNQSLVDLRLSDIPGTVLGPQGINPVMLVLPLLAALVISMAIIPVMVHLAPRFRLIDRPNPRKVHIVPVPRVGGIGIVLGSLLSVVLLLPFDAALRAYLFGALVLFGFGVTDDRREVGHYVKFIGQFIAVVAVVYFGGVFVTHLPLMGVEPVSAAVGRPFTVFAMVGMINAINHSDGLDGLAGGESLLSLSGIAYLAYHAGGTMVTIIAVATIGGLFGFMRFNTYPARIFMGDGGSQFLGYTLGFLTVLLTQQVNPALSPALPVLLLGLPIADILAVLIQRIYHRMNWFRATKNHIHHRLLELGLRHHESVMIVYSVQALMVFFAVLMPYAMDALLLAIYAVVVAAVFAFLYVAEPRGWHMHGESGQMASSGFFQSLRDNHRLLSLASCLVRCGLSLFLIAGAFIATRVPSDFTIATAALFVLLLLRLLGGFYVQFLPLRLLVYVAIVFVAYLTNTFQPDYMAGADPFTYSLFGVYVVGITLTIRSTDSGSFRVTPMDVLLVLVLLGLAVMANNGMLDANIISVALKTIILFYGAELILAVMKRRWNVFTVSVLVSLAVLGVRGIIGNYL